MNSMVCRRRGLLLAAVGAAFAGVVPGAITPALADDPAVAPIQRLTDGLLQIMKQGNATPFPQRYASLNPVIDQVFDLPLILRESVGPTWDTLPADQQKMLQEAFERYTVSSYVNSFDSYNGQQFIVSPSTRAVGNDQVVRTEIIPRSGEKHVLDYVMRNSNGGWKVVDVLADGSVSRVAVQRSDFRRLLAKGGAPALAESLRTKSAALSG
ncbi:ABC transporter substrate-binding protein [Rhodopila sp.]|uniref:ABC transporter substrate-binding protein n=1 Tax=Rhodopila sp. TaxID=2480087 RepID=UPI002C455B74|nr:ABC transporter substrate-binding protein [Rhodopila sp.]HVZ06956.1 ABC transporter substrate-binding protein [Rhodopila sp.]